MQLIDVLELRVRYSETDQLGTFYNSRALEWFECGRTELMRKLGLPYTDTESKGVYLPLVESHVEYLGRARYDDLLIVASGWELFRRASMRFETNIRHASGGAPVVRGYTIHAFTDLTGKAIRPPAWLIEAMAKLPKSPSDNS